MLDVLAMAATAAGTRFIIVTQITVQPVQTDNIINALVGTSVSVTCDAKLALLDSNVCEHRGCVKVKWTPYCTQCTIVRTNGATESDRTVELFAGNSFYYFSFLILYHNC